MAESNGLDEGNVSVEVDRILASINVNGFIKGDLGLPRQPATQSLSVQDSSNATAESESLSASVTATKLVIPPATSILADFIASSTPSLLTDSLKEQLYECVLDYLGVTAAGAVLSPSSTPILNGILAFNQHHTLPAGQGCTVITKQQTHPPHIAALLNGTYGHSLDFDDTHAESSLHAGVTAISTALAEAEFQLRQDSSSVTPGLLLLSILLGYEVTIRVGVALSTAAYSRGFHMTSVAGVFGCVATLAVLRRLPANIIMNAFGLAGSKAAGSMQYLANGSHNKRLHAGFAAHDSFLCVSLAEAGVIGADAILEGDLGLLQGYTDRSRMDVDWQRFIGNLGTHWEFADSALKPYAGCRMTHGFVEMADSLSKHIRDGNFTDRGVYGNGLESVKKIRCVMPKANMILVGQKTPNKVHPENIVDAQFSAYYQVANAVVFGGTHDMAAYAPDRLQNPDIKKMCDKVDCLVDDKMKGMSCRMDVFLQDEDGNVVDVVKREVLEPLGERSHPFVRQGVETKFVELMSQAYGKGNNRIEQIKRTVGALTTGIGKSEDILDLMSLVAVQDITIPN